MIPRADLWDDEDDNSEHGSAYEAHGVVYSSDDNSIPDPDQYKK